MSDVDWEQITLLIALTNSLYRVMAANYFYLQFLYFTAIPELLSVKTTTQWNTHHIGLGLSPFCRPIDQFSLPRSFEKL